MSMKEMIRREKHIVIHGQTKRFRIVKYAILLAFLIPFAMWKGAEALFQLLFGLFVISIAIHLLFRWKTKAWTRSWGPYKKIDLPE